MLPPGAAKARKWLLTLTKAENTEKARQRQSRKTLNVHVHIAFISVYEPNKGSVLLSTVFICPLYLDGNA